MFIHEPWVHPGLIKLQVMNMDGQDEQDEQDALTDVDWQFQAFAGQWNAHLPSDRQQILD